MNNYDMNVLVLHIVNVFTSACTYNVCKGHTIFEKQYEHIVSYANMYNVRCTYQVHNNICDTLHTILTEKDMCTSVCPYVTDVPHVRMYVRTLRYTFMWVTI
jgi:hypothetical protein